MSTAQDIINKIKQQVEQTDLGDQLNNKGEVLEIKDGVALVGGLHKVMFSEIVEFENGLKGLVLDLLPDQVGVLILGDYSKVSQGNTVNASGKVFSINV
jgi:F-type H+-transporting ATPase subunit alpha